MGRRPFPIAARHAATIAALVLSPLLASAAWLGCVGDDPAATASSAPAGSRGGACYPNGTCDPGLSCIDSLCVAAGNGEGGTGGDGGDQVDAAGPNDAGGPVEGGVDAGDCDAAPPASSTAIPCGDSGGKCVAGTERCCVNATTMTAQCAGNCNGMIAFSCSSQASCMSVNPASPFCCLSALTPAPTCPATLTLGPSAKVSAECSNDDVCSGGLRLCAGNEPCPAGQTCRPLVLTLPTNPQATQTFGVCL